MAKVKTILAYGAMIALAPVELFKRLTDKVKVADAVEKAKTKFVENLKEFAKEVAALKTLYTQRIEKHEIPGDTSFKKYFKDNVGGELPGRVEALATLFNALCLTLDAKGKPLLLEENFDAAAVDWLEKAAAIVNAARKKHGDNWKNCDEVLDTINALSKPGDALKALKEIRAAQKGEKQPEAKDGENTSAVVVTPKLAAEYLIAAIKNAKSLSPEAQFDLFNLSMEVTSAWDHSGIANETLNAFSDRITTALKAGVAPHLEIVTGGQPSAAETPAPAPAKNGKRKAAATPEPVAA